MAVDYAALARKHGGMIPEGEAPLGAASMRAGGEFVPPAHEFMGDDEPLEDPGFLDPLNYIPFGGPASLVRGGKPILQTARAVPGMVRASGPLAVGALKATGRAVGRRVLGPGNFDTMVKEIGSAASRVGGEAVEGGAMSAADRIRALKPLRANASRQAKKEHLLELESAMKEMGLDAPAKKALREQLGAVTKPNLTVVKGSKAVEPEIGSAASRAAKPAAEAGKEAVGPRHTVKYFSKSKGKYIDIEDMNQAHIEPAYRELAKTNPKPGSLADKVMKALVEEGKYRYQTTGMHVGHIRAK